MYGTVAHFRLKPGMEAALLGLIQEFDRHPPAGYIGEYIYRMDEDPLSYFMVAVFESRETYFANADSAEQNARYEKFRAMLEADPEWHDGEIVAYPEMRH